MLLGAVGIFGNIPTMARSAQSLISKGWAATARWSQTVRPN